MLLSQILLIFVQLPVGPLGTVGVVLHRKTFSCVNLYYSNLANSNQKEIIATEASTYGMTIYLLFQTSLWVCLSYCIVDVFIIAIGFILRLMAGSIATHIQLSHWIVLMTFLLALFLALAKRRDDVIMFEQEGKQMRKNISRYNLSFLDTTISITVSITLVCYLMYTVSDDVTARINSPYIYFTSLFVFLGMYRYLQITIVDHKSGSPTKILLKDSFIQICIICWILSFIFILYL